MSQFIMISSAPKVIPPPGIFIHSISVTEDFLHEVACKYFPDSKDYRLVVDKDGATESLVDAVWEAQKSGQRVEEVPLVKFLAKLSESPIDFICWCSSDWKNLPVVVSWPTILAELLRQTSAQPAELYMQYSRRQ
jgi:hypothetical protein